MPNPTTQPPGNNAIAPYITNTYGAFGLPAAASQVSPVIDSILASTYDPVLATTSSSSLAVANLYLGRVPLPGSLVVTNAVVWITAVGSSTLTNSFLALYTSTGTKIAQTADQSTNWQTGGTIGAYQVALVSGPYTVDPIQANDFLWIGFYVGAAGGSMPTIAALTGGNPNTINLGTTTARTRFGRLSVASTTTLPNFTPSGLTVVPNPVFLGLS